MEEQSTSPTEPANPPLFTLDLGANGGLLAPTSAQDLQTWVQREYEFWTWTQSVGGSHKNAFDHAWQPMHSAMSLASEAVQYWAQGNVNAGVERVDQVRNHIIETFLNRQLPHSSSPIGQRISALKEWPRVAIAYLFPFLPAMYGQNFQFEARDPESWRGFIMGLNERYGIVTDAEPAVRAERDALGELRKRGEKLLGEKREAADQLHRNFAETARDIGAVKATQETSFNELMTASKEAHDQALEKHTKEMEALRKTFQESMTLRGPVQYWQTKAEGHATKSSSLMRWMFGSMAGLGVALCLIAAWVFATLDQGKPDTWKVAVLVLIGVLGVWAVRIVVRMFLSHTHLATDAEERVTMVMTYLAFLEGEKMPSDDDRKLVLTPLFRPATDGIVKDEGLPHPMLELFTRTSQK